MIDPKTEAAAALKYRDARALPAPPIALWAFGALLVACALWAAFQS